MSTKRGDPRNQRRYKAARLVVLSRDQYTCYYCNSPDATTADHLVPVSKMDNIEDAYDPNNMVACCKRCNSSRGNKSHARFLAITATPPAFLSPLSPKMVETVHEGPMTRGIKPQ